MGLGTVAWEIGRGTCAIQGGQGGNLGHGKPQAGTPKTQSLQVKCAAFFDQFFSWSFWSSSTLPPLVVLHCIVLHFVVSCFVLCCVVVM